MLGRRCNKIVDYLLLPLFSSYGLFFNTDDFTDTFLSFSQSCTPVIILFVDCNTWLYSCFVLAHDGTRQDMCSGSGSAAATEGFLAKRAKSILGSALFCCSVICNCKILPNIMCICCFAFRVFWIFIVASNIMHASCENKNQPAHIFLAGTNLTVLTHIKKSCTRRHLAGLEPQPTEP